VDIQIRAANSKDLDSILAVQARALRVLSVRDYSQKQIESLVTGQAKTRNLKDEIIFVAEHENQIVGFSCLLNAGSLISGIFVCPDFARQGVGTKLLEAIEAQAIEQNCKVLSVMSSLSGFDFYRANGYQVVQKSGFLSSGAVWIPCVTLKKQLIASTESERRPGRFAASVFWLALASFLVVVFSKQMDFTIGDDRSLETSLPPTEESFEWGDPIPSVPYHCAAESPARTPTAIVQDNSEAVGSDRTITIVGTFSTLMTAQQAFAALETLTPSSSEEPLQIELQMFGQSIFATTADTTAQAAIVRQIERLGGLLLYSDDSNEKSIVAYLDVQAPTTAVATTVAEELELYFSVPYSFYLRPPWLQTDIPVAQQKTEYKARYTYHKLMETTEAELAQLNPRPLLWQHIMAGILRDPDRMMKLHQKMATRSAKLQRQKAARLLASNDPNLDRETVALFLEVLEDHQRQIAIYETDPHLNMEIDSKLNRKLGKRLGQLDLQSIPPAPQDIRFSVHGSLKRYEQRLLLDWLFFDEIQTGLPALGNYLCDRNFSNIKYTLVDFDNVRGD